MSGQRLAPRAAAGLPRVDWTQVEVPAIWQMIREEDDYFVGAQADAWRRTAELLDQHRLRLQMLADVMSFVWPPVADSPAAVFQSVLAELTRSVAGTSEDAATNGIFVARISQVLMHARTVIEQLNADWPGHTVANGSEQRSIPQKQAVKTMSDADEMSYDYGTRLVVTDPYVGTGYSDTLTPLNPSGGGSQGGGAGGSIGSGSHAGVLPPFGSGAPGGPGPSSPDPLLGGSPLPLLPAQASIPGGSGGPGGPSANGPGQSAALPSSSPANLIAAYPRGGIFGPGGGPTSRSVGSGDDSVARFGTEAGGGGRTPAGSTPTGSATTDEHGLVPGMAGHGASGGARRRRESGDRYTEWSVVQGVRPVLESAVEPTHHDPGSGVWGIDR